MKPDFVKMLAGVCVAGGLGAPAFADVTGAAQDVIACRDITDDAAKLACYESAAAGLEAALSNPADTAAPATAPLVADVAEPIDQTMAAEAKLPIWARLSRSAQEELAKKADKEDRPPENKELQVMVVRIVRNNVGRHYLTLDNGQVWRQTRPGAIDAPSALPAPGRIRQALTGNPWFEFDEHPHDDFKIVRVK